MLVTFSVAEPRVRCVGRLDVRCTARPTHLDFVIDMSREIDGRVARQSGTTPRKLRQSGCCSRYLKACTSRWGPRPADALGRTGSRWVSGPWRRPRYFRQPTRVNGVSESAADCVVGAGRDGGVCAVAARPAIRHAPQVATMIFLMATSPRRHIHSCRHSQGLAGFTPASATVFVHRPSSFVLCPLSLPPSGLCFALHRRD